MHDLKVSIPVTKVLYALLLATLCSYIWVGPTPMPFGGPDVVLGILTTLLGVTCLLVPSIRKRVSLFGDFGLLLGAALGLLAVTTCIHLFFQSSWTLARELVWIIMGIGMLTATWLTTHRASRLYLLIAVFVFAVFVSAFVGVADTVVQFVRLGEVPVNKYFTSLHGDNFFNVQPALGIPLAFALLIYDPWRDVFDLSPGKRILINTGTAFVLTVLIVALLSSGTRASALGSAAGLCIVFAGGYRRGFILDRRVKGTFSILIGILILIFASNDILQINERLFSVSDASARVRVTLIDDALVHAWRHPWGTAPVDIPTDQDRERADHPRLIVNADPANPVSGQWVTLETQGAPKLVYRWQEWGMNGGWVDIPAEGPVSRQVRYASDDDVKLFRARTERHVDTGGLFTYSDSVFIRYSDPVPLQWQDPARLSPSPACSEGALSSAAQGYAVDTLDAVAYWPMGREGLWLIDQTGNGNHLTLFTPVFDLNFGHKPVLPGCTVMSPLSGVGHGRAEPDSSIANLFDNGGSVFFSFHANTTGHNGTTGYLFSKASTYLRLFEGGLNFRAEFEPRGGAWQSGNIPGGILNRDVWGVLLHDNGSPRNTPILYLKFRDVPDVVVTPMVRAVAAPLGVRKDDTGDAFIVGNGLSMQEAFDGHIDDLALFDTALTDSQVRTLLHRASSESAVPWNGAPSVFDTRSSGEASRTMLGGYLPHNQFLEILVRYGFIGLALFTTFYVVAVRSLIRTVRSVMNTRDGTAVFPVVSVAAVLASYVVFGLFHPTNPFTGHWYLFFLFGMIPAVRLLAPKQSKWSKPPKPPKPSAS